MPSVGLGLDGDLLEDSGEAELGEAAECEPEREFELLAEPVVRVDGVEDESFSMLGWLSIEDPGGGDLG